MLFKRIDFLDVFALALLQIRDNTARVRLVGRSEIAKIKVVKPFLERIHRFLQINLMLGVIERKNVQTVGKMVKNQIQMPRNKLAFGNMQFVRLRRQRNRVAPRAEFVTQIADTARRHGNRVF